MVTSRTVPVATAGEGPDRREADGHLAIPPDGSGPGVLLLQELFGVNDYVRAVAARLAALGYVVLAPDVFWRIEPHVELAHDEAGMARGFEVLEGYLALGEDMIRADLCAALDGLRMRPEIAGGVGVVGFCLGGRLGYDLAVHGEPDALVSYYGSGIATALDGADAIRCPVLFHFGAADPFIPADEVERISSTFAARPDIDIRVHLGAGHAFDNPDSPGRDAEVAATAWAETVDFLDRNLRR